MSVGNVGGGFGRSYSLELGRNVNRSTSENTFVWRGDEGGADAEAGDADGTAFSFPLRLANAFKNPVLAVVSFPRDGPAIGITCCSGACGFNVAVAGWKLARGW